MESKAPQHDETIVPVRRDWRRAATAEQGEPVAPTSTHAGGSKRKGLALGGAAVLVALAVGTFVWLPSWVADNRAREQAARDAEAAAASAAAESAPAKPVLTPEEVAAQKARAESLLTNLLTQQKRLDAQNVASWGGDAWQRYGELSAAGDDAFLDEDFVVAVARYAEATSLGEELLERGGQTLDRALAAAEAAFAAGNAELALRQYDVVLGIEPEHAAAKAGRARAERLPEVLALVRRGDDARAGGDLDAALAAYREALAIDPDWEAARTAAREMSTAIAEAQFDRALSAGFAALEKEQYAEAIESFRAALERKPASREARDGLTQAEHGLELDKIALAQARALAFERRELWDQAIAQYQDALEKDATLVFAQTGLDRSQTRQALDKKLQNLIDNPTLLFSDTVLADARKLVEEASREAEKGPRLQAQIEKLGGLVALASTPIPVRLESDQLTEVTLYRVGALGVFVSKEVALRPGTYTAIGSRDGYRDVRQTFTVLPGREIAPISVVCVEPI